MTRHCTAILSLLRLLVLILAGLSAPSVLAAEAEPTQLLSGQSLERIEGRAVYLLNDAGRYPTVGEALAAYRSGQFSEDFSSQSGTDAFERGLWIALEMRYPKAADSQPLRGVLGFGGIFVVHPQVYLVRNGGAPEEILSTRTGEGGSLVSRYFTYLRSSSVDISPGDELLVLIHTSRADRPTVGFFREGELGSRQIVATLIKGGFTFILLFIGIVLAIISILTGRMIGLLIAGGFCLVMVQNDTSLFTTTFIDSPYDARQVWEAITLITSFYLYYGFLYSFRRELRLGKSKLLLVLGCLLPLPLIWVAYQSDTTADIMWAYYLSLFMFACTITFKFDIAPGLRIAAGLMMVGASLGAVLMDPIYVGQSIPDLTLEFIRDLLRTMAAVGLVILVLVDVQRSRRERIDAAKERMRALEVQAETDRRLLQTEREYARAREAAARRKAQLAAASHDIRQPIVGLRSALATEADSLTPALQSRLGEAIDYLEKLTVEYSDREENVLAAGQTDKEEPYSLDLIVRAVGDMFRDEAKERGIELLLHGADCQTCVPALALIRATSNLVANALRHANAQTVTVEVHHNSHCELIVEDDGAGIAPDVLESLQQPGAKGASSDGDGLGLAIIHDLAKRHGFRFTMDSTLGQGTKAVLDLAGA